MTVERALRLIAGAFVALSVLLGIYVNANFLWFTLFVGVNLFQSAFTNWCPMMVILRKGGLPDATAPGTPVTRYAITRQWSALRHPFLRHGGLQSIGPHRHRHRSVRFRRRPRRPSHSRLVRSWCSSLGRGQSFARSTHLVLRQCEIVVQRARPERLAKPGERERTHGKLRTIKPASVCGAKNPRNQIAPFCLPETNVCSRLSYAANARAQSPSARCSSPARTYASSIPRPVPSPASSEGQAAASPTSATPTGAPLRQMDLADAIEVHVLGGVHRVEQLRHFPSHVADTPGAARGAGRHGRDDRRRCVRCRTPA